MNNKEETVQLKIEDQFPISKISDINVELKEFASAQVNQYDGSLIWTLSLEPHEQRNISFEYEVKAPKDRRLIVE